MSLDIDLEDHHWYPVIPEWVKVGDIVDRIKEYYTWKISTAMSALLARMDKDDEKIEEQMGILLQNPHIYDAVWELFPELFDGGKEVNWHELLEYVCDHKEAFRDALDFLTKPLGQFTERYLWENVIKNGNFKSLGDLISKIEGLPARLQWNPRLPQRYKKIHWGKVRETYQHPDNQDELIMIATDRISTHDVIHMWTISGKWKALTKMSNFWFQEFSRNESTRDIPNQLVNNSNLPDDFPQELRESTTVVKKLQALPIEAIVRWYLYGSAEKWYNKKTWRLKTGEDIGKNRGICYKFPEPMFTPSTKSDVGDVNVNFQTMVEVLDGWLYENKYTKDNWFDIDPDQLAEQIRDYSLRMYEHANKVSQTKGMILGDTKFEFGLDKDWKLTLIDEACTADSSRLWTAVSVVEWEEPESHDKQPIRDEVIEYWRNNPDRNGRHYGEKDFKKYPVLLTDNTISQGAERCASISQVFSEAA